MPDRLPRATPGNTQKGKYKHEKAPVVRLWQEGPERTDGRCGSLGKRCGSGKDGDLRFDAGVCWSPSKAPARCLRDFRDVPLAFTDRRRDVHILPPEAGNNINRK